MSKFCPMCGSQKDYFCFDCVSCKIDVEFLEPVYEDGIYIGYHNPRKSKKIYSPHKVQPWKYLKEEHEIST